MVQPSVQNAILAIDTNEMIELVDIILFQMRKNELVVTLRVQHAPERMITNEKVDITGFT